MQRDMQFPWDGVTGDVHVDCVPNDDPEAYGCWHTGAVGYPVCTATVHFSRRGYGAMFGWVQLVRSTDNESRGEQFEVDPFALFGDAQSPYCWYGTEPTLFDAPSRPVLLHPSGWRTASWPRLPSTSCSTAIRVGSYLSWASAGDSRAATTQSISTRSDR
jgi:hypothetical protein